MGAVAEALFYKELIVTSFDPGHAAVIGLSPDRVRYGLLILLAFAIVTGIQTVGVVLISALLVTPAATASLLTHRLPLIMLIGSIISAIATVSGMLASYVADVSSGATIVLPKVPKVPLSCSPSSLPPSADTSDNDDREWARRGHSGVGFFVRARRGFF